MRSAGTSGDITRSVGRGERESSTENYFGVKIDFYRLNASYNISSKKKFQFNLQVNKHFSTEFAMAKFQENVYIRNICQI